MSYPLQPYQPNRGALVNPALNRPTPNQDQAVADLLVPIFGLAKQIMSELLQGGPGVDGLSALMGSDPRNPHMQVCGISSMNVTQVSRGPDGRPHIVQAIDERRLGPGGIWQTKKALRDPQRGIDKMQVGYFMGDQSEIVEHEFNSRSGQYQRPSHPWAQSNQPPAQRHYSYYPPAPPPSHRQQALPAPPSYRYR